MTDSPRHTNQESSGVSLAALRQACLAANHALGLALAALDPDVSPPPPGKRALTLAAIRAAMSQADDAHRRTDSVRPEVAMFALMMEAQLRFNDHKPGWKHDFPLDLYGRLREEADELHDATRDWDFYRANAETVTKEAADVANFAMMIADVVGGLTK